MFLIFATKTLGDEIRSHNLGSLNTYALITRPKNRFSDTVVSGCGCGNITYNNINYYDFQSGRASVSPRPRLTANESQKFWSERFFAVKNTRTVSDLDTLVLNPGRALSLINPGKHPSAVSYILHFSTTSYNCVWRFFWCNSKKVCSFYDPQRHFPAPTWF